MKIMIGGNMKLSVSARSLEKKRETKRIRRDGKIPAVLYSGGKEGSAIAVDANQFQAHLRQLKKGHLPTSKFVLVDENGKTREAIIKDIQYHPTTYSVVHLDFEELHSDARVNVKVPIECTGVADCPGIKLGGVLRQVIRYLKINCFPKDIPSSFQVDISSLGIKESMRLKDIKIAESIRPLVDLNEVAVAIVKR